MEINHQVDETCEFSAPRFFDFLNKETEEQIRKAEQWFETSLSYAPSPFMPKIRESRSVINGPLDFGDAEKIQKEPEVIEAGNHEVEQDSSVNGGGLQMVVDMEVTDRRGSFGFASDAKPCESNIVHQQEKISSAEVCFKSDSSFAFPVLDVAAAPEAAISKLGQASKELVHSNVKSLANSEALTPKVQRPPILETAVPMGSKNQTAKKVASLIKQSSGLKPKNHTPGQPTRGIKPQKSATKCPGSIRIKNSTSTDISQENQAIKRQKLDGGGSKKIHNVKAPVLLHKSKPCLSGGNDLSTLGVKGHQEQRKEVAPYISTAEMVKKFQSRTREIELPQNRSFSQDTTTSMIQMRPKLTLTRPKEPELETAQRVRAVRIKSSAELEEEMLAKVPRFKARPVNKKIFEAPSLPTLPRSTPQPPDFHEFHLKTMERANQHAETASVVSSADASSLNQCKLLKLTEPRPPVLETALRARPTKVKSSHELELEEFEKIPKFKARPLNKKIFASKGDLGLFCQSKSQITTPQEFNFATNDRLGRPPSTMIDLFDKLSLHSESSHHSQQDKPKITKPDPFHLHTEERGLDKEKLFTLQTLQKQLEEEKARIRKANPYPYTTDYPVMPPKPQPKQSTKPEVFHLDSLIRHEEEMQKRMEEMERMEREEAERKIFRAQPIMKEDPIPLPERERKPLTEIQEFVLHVDHRAVERSEFDKKVKDKELTGKRIREEQDHAKMIEEEKEIKQMRRTMVTYARPIPKFDNPFHPQKSTKEKTRPKSPKLLVKQRERKHALHLR